MGKQTRHVYIDTTEASAQLVEPNLNYKTGNFESASTLLLSPQKCNVFEYVSQFLNSMT